MILVPGRIRKALYAVKAAARSFTQSEAFTMDERIDLMIPLDKINRFQVASILRLIDRAKHAHMTDIKLRINGKDEWYEADWLKHLQLSDSAGADPT